MLISVLKIKIVNFTLWCYMWVGSPILVASITASVMRCDFKGLNSVLLSAIIPYFEKAHVKKGNWF
jgi:hypothetical protein